MWWAVLALAVGVTSGCSGSSVLHGSELEVTGFGFYRLGALLLTPSTGCLGQKSTTSYSLDGAVLPLVGPCGALSADGLGDGQFTIGVRNGDESGEVVVTNMFPGLQATILNPPAGKVAPGGELTVAVPAVLQATVPYRAWFEYTDTDDPTYVGESAFISTLTLNPPGASAEQRLQAPTHTGHFKVKVEMQPTSDSAIPPGTLVSCSGVAKCSIQAAIDLGPMAIEVVQP